MNKIIIHHSGTADGPTLSWGAIRKWHVDHNGWADIGYHAGCELVGDHYEVLYGRPWDRAGAHCPTQNAVALGFCFVGDFTEMPPPEAQIDAGARLIREWLRLFAIPVTEIYPHYRFSDTDCPGKEFDWAYLRWAVNNGI